jgi:hypothetical protein
VTVGLPLRALAAVPALVIGVWLALLLRDTQHLNHVADPAQVYAQLHTQSAYDDAMRETHSARTLNPDRMPDLVLANLLFLHNAPGDRAHALRLALGVGRAEPDDLFAWRRVLTYALAVHRGDVAAEARTRLRALDPIDTRAPGALP